MPFWGEFCSNLRFGTRGLLGRSNKLLATVVEVECTDRETCESHEARRRGMGW